MRIAYISPFKNETNDYINRVKSVLQDAGFQVKPFSFRTLLSAEVFGLFNRQNLVLIHWLESRVFAEGRDAARVKFSGLLQFLVYLLLLMTMRAKLVYFVHDHAVHDLAGWRRTFSVRLIDLLCRLASLRVVHDPSYTQIYNAVYLPHPLYDERDLTCPGSNLEREQTFMAGVLGAIRPYKRIEDMIRVWPPGPTLLIRGRADDAYERFLQEAIAARGGEIKVDLKTGFLSRQDFMVEMRRLDALILPHADATMLVSGAFFEAVGAIPFVIARETPFTKWAATQFNGVLTFRSDDELRAQLDHAIQGRAEARNQMALTARKADALFGHVACVHLYGEALRRI